MGGLTPPLEPQVQASSPAVRLPMSGSPLLSPLGDGADGVDLPSFVDGMKVLHVARFVVTVLPRGVAQWLASYKQHWGKCCRVRRTVRHSRCRSTIGIKAGACR